MAKLIKIRRKDGSLSDKWYSDFRSNKKRIHRALSRNKPEAQRMLDDLKELARTERHGGTPRNLSWHIFKKLYLVHRRSGTTSPLTIRKDETAFKMVDRARLIASLSQMTPEMLTSLQGRWRERNIPESVITRAIHSLITALRWGEDAKYAGMQNWRTVKVEQSVGRVDYYDFEAFEELVGHFGGMVETAVLLMGRAGLRIGEVYHLEWPDIQFDLHQIYFTSKPHLGWKVKGDKKGKKKRIIPLIDDLEAHLQALPRATGFVLGCDRPKSLGLFYHLIQNALKATGVKTHHAKDGTPHVLRHSFASYLISNGATLEEVGEFLGHSDPQTTKIYTHLMPHAQAKAIKKLPKMRSAFGPGVRHNGSDKIDAGKPQLPL